MWTLKVDGTFSAAHQLTNYSGPCENLHGHTWKIQLEVQGEVLDDAGMLMDFRVLKNHLREIHNEFDHKLLNDVVDFSPTSENLSKYIFLKQKGKMPNNVRLKSVTVWESDASSASYSE